MKGGNGDSFQIRHLGPVSRIFWDDWPFMADKKIKISKKITILFYHTNICFVRGGNVKNTRLS